LGSFSLSFSSQAFSNHHLCAQLQFERIEKYIGKMSADSSFETIDEITGEVIVHPKEDHVPCNLCGSIVDLTVSYIEDFVYNFNKIFELIICVTHFDVIYPLVRALFSVRPKF